ncbi:MAG: hypothetical protein KAI74_05300, partial [Kiritimatiellae bacterium]|nr:hypothetical protein [Kiritimatiellia bacterium]
MPQEIEENEQIDIRLYIGMVFFHWKTIVVCFLYALLGGVLYIDFTAPQYEASCAISIFRDPLTTVTSAAGQWARPSTHARLLSSADSRNRTVDQLFDEWSEQVGGRQAMDLPVSARPGRAGVVISVKSVNRDYAIVFLDTLLAQHEVQWRSKQRQSMSNAMKALLAEIALTEEKIEEAQNNIIEYIRLNDLTRQTIRASVEEGFIKRIMHRRTALETELFMMETANPDLKNSNLAVISAVDSMA